MATLPGSDSPQSLIRCTVVTPERTILDASVEFVAVPLYDGELGMLPGRAPFVGRLGPGELRTRSGNSVQRYFVDGGFAQLRDNLLTVLTPRAIPAQQISVGETDKELAAAQAVTARTEAQHDEKARAINRARAQARLAGKL